MCCNVKSLKSEIQTLSLLGKIISSRSEVLKELEYSIVVGTCMLHEALGDWQQYCHDYVGGWFLNIDSRPLSKEQVRSVRHCTHICKVVYHDI